MELARVSDASDAWLRTGVGGLVESLVLTLFSVTEYNLVALRTTGAQGNQVA